MNLRSVAYPLLAAAIVAVLLYTRPERSEKDAEPSTPAEPQPVPAAATQQGFSWLRPVSFETPPEPVLRVGPIEDVVDRCFEIATWAPLDKRNSALERLMMVDDPEAVERLIAKTEEFWRRDPERAYIYLPVLGQLHHPDATAIVLEGAAHSRALVRQEAARALGMVDDAAAVERLEKLAGDPDEAVRSAAIRSLIEMHAPEALDVLVRYAERDPSERLKHVLFRLGQDTENPAGIPTLRKYLDPPGPIATLALRMLVRLGDLSSIDQVYRQIANGSPAEEFNGLQILREAPAELLDLSKFEDSLDAASADARYEACDTVYRMVKANVVTDREGLGKRLEKRLVDRDVRVRQIAVAILGALGRQDIIEPYVKLVATATADSLHNALEVAATFGQDHRVVPIILERMRAVPLPALADQSRMISALGTLNDPTSLEAYLTWIRGARYDEPLDASGISLSKRAVLHVVSLGPTIQPDLLAIVKDPAADPAARLRALDAIRGISGSNCHRELIEIASDTSQPLEVRIAAIDSLPSLKGIDYFEDLEDALDSFEDRQLRLHAVYVMLTNP